MAAVAGLVFSVSPTKKQQRKVNQDDEQYMLILAPFNKSPKINFGHVKLNQIIEKTLLIVNPQDFDLILNVKNQDLNINNMNINISQKSNVNFKLKWQPIKPDSYKFTIIFEVMNSRLKFNVHAFGICDEPPKKATQMPRKPLTVLQPIRSFGNALDTKKNKQNIEATLKSNKENKQMTSTTTTTTTFKKEFKIDSTFVVQDEHSLTQTIHEQNLFSSTSTHIITDLRRQTVVIQSPKMVNKYDDSCLDLKTPKMNNLRRSMSEANLMVIDEANDCTPKLEDFIRRRIEHTPSPVMASLQNIPKIQHNFHLNACVSVVHKSPVLKFNPKLYEDSDSDDSFIEHYLTLEKISKIIKCQRWLRYQRFRKALKKLRNDKRKYDESIIKIQNWIRAMKCRFEYLRIRNVIIKIQQKWRVKFARKREAAIKIQKWTRSMKPRFEYLRLKRAAVMIQRKWMISFNKKREAVVKIQKWSRSMRLRFEYLRNRRAVIKIQRNWRVKYESKCNAVLKIQKWTRSLKDRYKYLKTRRLICVIQQKWRVVYEQKREAVIKIQKWTRSMKLRYEYLRNRLAIIKIQQKWRVKFEYKRNAVVKIQNWTRSMKDRYDYLHLKRITIYIQQKFKAKYRLRTLAALKIQSFYRMYKMKQFEIERLKRFNEAATQIQSYWRGYKTRKEINIEKLFSIRQRLSVYIQRPEHLTLGMRIRRSLNNLQHSPSMQNVITSLIDLRTVTRLSQECCIIFTQSGTIEILYQFIGKCNRSQPHMDLIKLCLEILINLAKCKNTCELIIDNGDKLNLMLHLLQSYQLTNASIFMSVCVLLIILASNQQCKYLYNQLLNEAILKKMTSVYQILERRANIRVKNTRLNSNSGELDMSVSSNLNTTVTISSNQTIISSNMTFTFEPEWSLSKKRLIEFIEPLSALQFLLCSTLNTNVCNNINQDLQAIILKTPKKFLDSTGTGSSTRSTSVYESGSKTNSVTKSASTFSLRGGNASIVKTRVTPSLSVANKLTKSNDDKRNLNKIEHARRKLI